MSHRYLFTLEVAPAEAGKTYGDLPAHLTLMSRFFSDLTPDQLAERVRPLFAQTPPFELLFGSTMQLGPKKLTVHTVANSHELKQLHNRLRTLLDSVAATYEYPQFTSDGHKPHVTKREGVQFEAGDKHSAETACLVEVVDAKRVIRAKFVLGQ